MNKSESSKKNKTMCIQCITSYILCFFIAISMTTLFLSFALLNGVLNKDVFLSSFSSSNFYDEKIESLEANLSERLTTAGLFYQCGKDVFKPGVVIVDINRTLQQLINNQPVSIDYHKPGRILRNNINEYLLSKGIKEDDEINKAVDLLVEETDKDYNTQISFGYIKKFYDFIEKYRSPVQMARIISLVVLIISFLAMLFIRERVWQRIRFIEYSFFSGSVLTYSILEIMKHDILKYIPEKEGTYKTFIMLYINNSFSQGKYIFLVGILFIILLSIFNIYFKKQVI